MKKFILWFVGALVIVGLIYFGYPVIRGFLGNNAPVTPNQLNPEAKDFGTLKVEVSGKGRLIAGLEVDLGQPGGRMTYTMTDVNGVAIFENVSVGTYRIFFNDYNYPKEEFVRVASEIPVVIIKDQIIVKKIELMPKQ